MDKKHEMNNNNITINVKKQSISETCKPLLAKSRLLIQKTEETNIKCRHKCKDPQILISSLIASLSFIVIILFWLTDAYNRIVLERVILKNNSDILEWWLRPPVDPIVKVHVFNYTNIDRFLNGTDAKIKVVEVGPYSYREHIEKVNIRFNDDQITFHENRSHTFDIKASGENLTEDDFVNVPNIPFISAIPNVKNLGFFAEIGFKTIISMSKAKQFHSLSMKDLFFGYRDEFMNLISKIKWDFTPEDVGVLAPRRGVTKKSVTVNSGTKNVNDVGKVIAVQDKKNIWKTDKCNNIDGSDGVIYGPNRVRSHQDVTVYLPEFCRSLPLAFVEKSEILDGIPAFLYRAPEGTFSTKINNETESEYYCELNSNKENHIDGTMEVTDCIDGNPPIVISHPHFMEGDAKLFEHFDGITPNRSLHSSYAYLHPRMSVPLFGISRMQINLKVTKMNKHYEKFDGLILPIAWLETSTDSFPTKFNFLLFLSTIVVDYIEIVCKYGSILSFVLSTLYIVIKLLEFI